MTDEQIKKAHEIFDVIRAMGPVLSINYGAVYIGECLARAKADELTRCVEYIRNYTPPKGYSPLDSVEQALLRIVAYDLYKTKE